MPALRSEATRPLIGCDTSPDEVCPVLRSAAPYPLIGCDLPSDQVPPSLQSDATSPLIGCDLSVDHGPTILRSGATYPPDRGAPHSVRWCPHRRTRSTSAVHAFPGSVTVCQRATGLKSTSWRCATELSTTACGGCPPRVFARGRLPPAESSSGGSPAELMRGSSRKRWKRI